MNELTQQLVAKIGISEDQAQGSIEMVLAFVKTKLPENMHGMLDQILSGQETGSGGVSGLAQQALGGLFTKKD